MSDRKYRQRGYQDSGEERSKAPAEKISRKDTTFGPRPIQMPGTRTVSRCSQCGTVLPTTTEAGLCPKCGFELHSCKQCMYFDPSSRFECMQPVKERVARKDVRNECPSYAIRMTMEKETTTSVSVSPSGPTTPNDARQAFENLFKK